jgi:putative FmdB family regulatory protein
VPTYQYLCNDCGEPLEIVQNFTDDALTDCPQCEGRLRKVFNAVGVVFKGSGFYKTDSAGGGGSKTPDAASSGKSEAAASTSSSTSTS